METYIRYKSKHNHLKQTGGANATVQIQENLVPKVDSGNSIEGGKKPEIFWDLIRQIYDK